MILKNKFVSLLVLVMFFSIPLVFAEEPAIYVDVSKGDCVSVDLNDDEIADVIICYNEDDTITIDDVIAIDENIESVINDSTIIIPSSITTIKKYELPFDEEKLKNEIMTEHMKYFYILGILVILSLILIIFDIFSKTRCLFNLCRFKNSKRKKISKKVKKRKKKRK